MRLKRGIEVGSANILNWWHKWAIWEVAIMVKCYFSCLDAGKL